MDLLIYFIIFQTACCQRFSPNCFVKCMKFILTFFILQIIKNFTLREIFAKLAKFRLFL